MLSNMCRPVTSRDFLIPLTEASQEFSEQPSSIGLVLARWLERNERLLTNLEQFTSSEICIRNSSIDFLCTLIYGSDFLKSWLW